MHTLTQQGKDTTCIDIHTTHLYTNTSIIAYMFLLGINVMPMTIRLNDKEQEEIRKKAVEINRILIQKGLQPVRDSELIHIILEQSIAYTEVSASGKIKVNTD